MWQSIVEDELKATLAVAEHVSLSACVTLGRPQGHQGRVRREPLTDVVFDDESGAAITRTTDPT